MADQLKKAIRKSGKTVNAIAVEAGVPQPVLYRFVRGERDLTLTTVQKLADHFGMELRHKK
jgi:plasmid maintenance system antidote protein VapI